MPEALGRQPIAFPDLIVMDEMMPGSILGTVAMRALRRAGCNAAIVGFSGSAMAEAHKAAGADLSWSKPLPNPAEITDALAGAFSRRRGREEGALGVREVELSCGAQASV